MRKFGMMLLLLLIAGISGAQEGNATITMVDNTLGAKKHTEILSLTFAQILDFHTKAAIYNFEGNKIFKGKRPDEHVMTVNVANLREGTGTIVLASTGKVILSTKEGAMYFGDITAGESADVANLAFKIGEYNVKKIQQFYHSEIDGQPTASYKGNQLNDMEEILILICLAERFYNRTFLE